MIICISVCPITIGAIFAGTDNRRLRKSISILFKNCSTSPASCVSFRSLRNFNFVISFLYFSCSACSFSFCRFVPLPTSAFILKSMYSCTHFSALYFRLSVTNSNNPCSFKFLTCRDEIPSSAASCF